MALSLPFDDKFATLDCAFIFYVRQFSLAPTGKEVAISRMMLTLQGLR